MNSNFTVFFNFKRITKKENLALLSIIALASLVRLWDLGWNGFNGDESIYSGQAAALLGEEEFIEYFSVFRSHPLLLQFFVALTFAVTGIHDVTARIVPAILGIFTVALTYFIGRDLFNKRVGIVAALVMAVNPYSIVLSRQVLLDVPLSFFFTLTLYLIVRYRTHQTHFLAYLVGITSGLSFLSKEVGIFAIVVFLLYTALRRKINIPKSIIALAGFCLAASPSLIALILFPEAQEALLAHSSFQLSRETNTDMDFYPEVLVQEALGYLLVLMCIIAAVLGIISKREVVKDQMILLCISILVPLIFFQLIPIKGVRFLLPIIPACAVLGSSLIFSRLIENIPKHRFVVIILIPLILLSNNFFLAMVLPLPPLKSFGHLGTPLEREIALWIRNNTLSNDTILTAGPRMSDIIKFYTTREVVTIRDNPNPSYAEVESAGLMIINNQINYLIQVSREIDSYKNLNEKISSYVKLFNATLVYNGYSDEVYTNDTFGKFGMRVYKVN